MKPLHSIFAVLFAALLSSQTQAEEKIYVAVIGGFSRSGLWDELTKQFQAASKYKLQLVDTGNRDLVAGLFRDGELDLAVLHGGSVASNLLTESFAGKMWTWVHNDFVIIGPTNDPAKIRDLQSGAEALKRIASSKSAFVDYRNSGPSDLAASLWKSAGITPSDNWFLKTSSDSSESALEFARTNHAYLLLGRVPKVPAQLEILVQGDPIMQRPFVVVEANKKRFPTANTEGIHALSEFLSSKETAAFLKKFASNSPPGVPIFWPAINE